MFKYKMLNGKKVLVDAKGAFIKNADGENIEVTDESIAEFNEADIPEDDDAKDEAVEEMKGYFKTLKAEMTKEFMEKFDLSQKSFNKELLAEMKEAFGAETKDSGLDVNAIIKGIADVKAGAGRSYEVNVKTLSELSSLTGDVIAPDRRAEIDSPVKRDLFIEELAAAESTNSDKIEWVEKAGESGAPADTAELAKFPEKDYTFQTVRETVRKVAVMHKHSIEILEDAPQLVSFVKNELMGDLKIKVEDLLLSGSGTNEWNGILNRVPTFSAGSLADTLPTGTATKLDILRVAISQIKVAGLGTKRFNPTAIVMNPADTVELELTKGDDGHYVMPPFTTNDRTTIKGVRIVENPAIAVGSFLVGDFSKVAVVNRRGYTLQVATENADDFEKDMMSVRLSRRAALRLKTNDNGAFVSDTFANAVTALEA